MAQPSGWNHPRLGVGAVTWLQLGDAAHQLVATTGQVEHHHVTELAQQHGVDRAAVSHAEDPPCAFPPFRAIRSVVGPRDPTREAGVLFLLLRERPQAERLVREVLKRQLSAHGVRGRDSVTKELTAAIKAPKAAADGEPKRRGRPPKRKAEELAIAERAARAAAGGDTDAGDADEERDDDDNGGGETRAARAPAKKRKLRGRCASHSHS